MVNRPVLIVDDNADVRVLVARIMRLLGQEPVCASGGGEAWRTCARTPDKLVLLDLMMPRWNGLAVMRAIRSDRGWPAPVVVFQWGGRTRLEQALSSGADDYLRKGLGGRCGLQGRWTASASCQLNAVLAQPRTSALRGLVHAAASDVLRSRHGAPAHGASSNRDTTVRAASTHGSKRGACGPPRSSRDQSHPPRPAVRGAGPNRVGRRRPCAAGAMRDIGIPLGARRLRCEGQR